MLTFSTKKGGAIIKKVLNSAIANAENNHGLDVDRLYVAEAYVGIAVKMRRFHARGRGKSAPIEKMFSRLTVVVRERDGDGAPKKKAKGAAAKTAAPKAEKKETAKKAAPKKAAAKKDKE